MEEVKDIQQKPGITLYAMNQALMEEQQALDEHQLHKGRKLIDKFFKQSSDRYFMMLSNEKKYYTVFNFLSGKDNTREAADQAINCLRNIGDIKSIETTADKVAIEIWVDTDVYYLFPYDLGVIEIGE